jgi:hypothetical protein
MGRVLFAGSAVTLFALALVVLLATGGGDRIVAALTIAGLACLSVSFLLHVAGAPRG